MRKKWILIGILVVLLLAGAAYSLPRLLSGAAPGLSGPAEPAASQGHLDITFIPAPQLPQRPPDTVGSTADVKDNSIFVTPRNGGTPYEVVVTPDTRIWQDTNENIPPKTEGSQGGSLRVQETVKAIPIDQVALNVDVLVWGEQRGIRWIASAVLVRGGK